MNSDLLGTNLLQAQWSVLPIVDPFVDERIDTEAESTPQSTKQESEDPDPEVG